MVDAGLLIFLTIAVMAVRALIAAKVVGSEGRDCSVIMVSILTPRVERPLELTPPVSAPLGSPSLEPPPKGPWLGTPMEAALLAALLVPFVDVGPLSTECTELAVVDFDMDCLQYKATDE